MKKEMKDMSEYQKPEMAVFELEGQTLMLETSEIGLGGEGEGDAIGKRNPFGSPFGNPFGNPFGGNPFSKPFGF